jgi:hypothetical protein
MGRVNPAIEIRCDEAAARPSASLVRAAECASRFEDSRG